MEVTERRDLLREALAQRHGAGLTITIGGEHEDPPDVQPDTGYLAVSPAH